jgi:hypothetical protein
MDWCLLAAGMVATLRVTREQTAPAGVVVRAAAQLLGKPLVLALLAKVLLVAAELMATLAAAAAQVKLVCTKGAAAMDCSG